MTTHDYIAEATDAAAYLGLDMRRELFNINDWARGIEVEYEHGLIRPETNVTNDDPHSTAKIALAHLRETPDYYDRLEIAELPGLMTTKKIVGVLVVFSVAILILHFAQDHLSMSIIGDYTYHQLLVLIVFVWMIAGSYLYWR